MSVATRSSWARRSRSAASLACSRTSWATRIAGAAWAARVASSRRSSVEYSCSRQARAQVERADELALRDERDDQRDAGFAEGRDGGGLEVEPRDVDRAGRGLEVGEERVGFRDVDRHRRVGRHRRRRAGGIRRHRGLGGRRRLGGRAVAATEEAADRAGQFGHLVPHVRACSSGKRYGPVRRSQNPSWAGATEARTVLSRSAARVGRSTSSRSRSANASAILAPS